MIKTILKMKRILLTLMIPCILLNGCAMLNSSSSGEGTSILEAIFGSMSGKDAASAVASVIGLTKISAEDLIGNWSYESPGCAFTSDKLLAKAGGEVAAASIKGKLEPYYEKLGVKAANTFITLGEDNSFTAKIGGIPLSGTYAYDEENSTIALKSLLFSTNCYVKKNVGGVAFLFEADKILTVLQKVASVSGDTTFEAIGELSKQYDGVRLGFDMEK